MPVIRLSITVSSKNPELAIPFNINGGAVQVGTDGNVSAAASGGAKQMGIKSLFESGKIVADVRNKLFAYCFYNLKIRQDVNNNLSPHKAKSTGHIDGAVGVFNAFVAYQRAKEMPLYANRIGQLFRI